MHLIWNFKRGIKLKFFSVLKILLGSDELQYSKILFYFSILLLPSAVCPPPICRDIRNYPLNENFWLSLLSLSVPIPWPDVDFQWSNESTPDKVLFLNSLHSKKDLLVVLLEKCFLIEIRHWIAWYFSSLHCNFGPGNIILLFPFLHFSSFSSFSLNLLFSSI